eukprot:NODE_7815_length_1548_cov_7.488388.p1 GENE.NODE_7815_length_1548_cov_7.488388~~NODE_7815_length_1548_cov_7.488388.p1  ORF type:complete len:390 (+),score=68.55 NODE_7815_length_1548_cov_7.488388:96-1172(+)
MASTLCSDAAAAAAVSDVIMAPNLYAVIGTERTASTAEVRSAYLKAALRVHPDRNKHPNATKAFQRVASAWAVLGSNPLREHYDASLRRGDGDAAVQHEGSSMSADVVFQVFTFASGLDGHGHCGSSLDELMEMLYRAQEAPEEELGSPGELLAKAGLGYAFTAGLYVAGIASSAAGLPVTGATCCRLAMIQALTQSARLARVPAVQRAASDGFEIASAQLQQVGHWVEAMKESAAEHWHSSKGVGSCFQRTRKGSTKKLVNGTRVEFFGLASAPHLNGRRGVVQGYNAAIKRHEIKLSPVRVSYGSYSAADCVKAKCGFNLDGEVSACTEAEAIKLVRPENIWVCSRDPPRSPQDFL